MTGYASYITFIEMYLLVLNSLRLNQLLWKIYLDSTKSSYEA